MNYLTNYYKNLSEQLQEKINQLEKLIEAYPGGMTPGRQQILHANEMRRHSSNATPEEIQRADRAGDLRRRAVETDRVKEEQEYQKMKDTVSAMPGFHDKIVTHLSGQFADKFHGGDKDAAQKIAAQLHAAAGKGGFESFDHAVRAFTRFAQDNPAVDEHMQQIAMDNPMDYPIDADYHMDIDFSDEINDIVDDMTHRSLMALHPKK